MAPVCYAYRSSIRGVKSMARPKNLQELLLQAAARWSDRVAFRHITGTRVRELKYRHLAEISYRCAQTLWNSGLRHGDYALIWAPNSPDWVTTALGLLRLGGIVVPCDPTSSPQQILGLAKQLGRPVVVAGNKQYLQLADQFPAA